MSQSARTTTTSSLANGTEMTSISPVSVEASTNCMQRRASKEKNVGHCSEEKNINQATETNTRNTSDIATGDGLSMNSSMNVIDSALLCALRDQRERLSLLKLEQALVDFMRDKSVGHMDVGGPSNSIVIWGNRTSRAASDGSFYRCPPVLTAQQQQIAMNGARQTSFQRLIVHRLADRFNIVRENAGPPSESGDPYGGPVYSLGLIRLVKVQNSQIPKKLLIDVDLSAHANASNDQDSGRQFQRGGTNREISEHERAVKGLTGSMSSSSLSEGRGGHRGSPKKMMIMKRSNSGGDDRMASGKGKGFTLLNPGGKGREGRTGLKGKTLPDREKAYAEARARIFNESQNVNGGDGSDHAEDKEADETNKHQPSSTDDPSNEGMTEDGRIMPPLERKLSSSNAIDSSPPVLMLNSEVATADQKTSVPAAASAGGVSKVTWRNRRQEENDPDFRRRAPVRAAMHQPGSPYVMAAAGGVIHGVEYGGSMLPAPLSGALNAQQHLMVDPYNMGVQHPRVFSQQSGFVPQAPAQQNHVETIGLDRRLSRESLSDSATSKQNGSFSEAISTFQQKEPGQGAPVAANYRSDAAPVWCRASPPGDDASSVPSLQ